MYIGYLAFELLYLHKPADLTHIQYSPLQHLSKFLGHFMKIMKKRFDVLRKIFLDEKAHDQFVQKIRQIRTFPRNHTFVVGDLVYLFAPSSFCSFIWKKMPKMFEDYWIGPLQVKVLVKSHYPLAVWQGKLLPFIVSSAHTQTKTFLPSFR